jgi:hypothetical protein
LAHSRRPSERHSGEENPQFGPQTSGTDESAVTNLVSSSFLDTSTTLFKALLTESENF